MIGFVTTGLLAGTGGWLYAHFVRFVDPGIFGFTLLFDTVFAVLIGGTGTLGGPIVGSLFVVLLPQLLGKMPVENIESEEPIREFLRTPNQYGYTTFALTPGGRFNASLSGVYTGPMKLVHFAGAPEQVTDSYLTTSSYFEFGLKVGYTFKFEVIDSGIEIFAGIKNFTNSYQDDFDTGKNRDSGYIYGPAMPRTIYAGIRLFSF